MTFAVLSLVASWQLVSCGHASSFAHYSGPVAGPGHAVTVGGYGGHGHGYGHGYEGGHGGHSVDYVVRTTSSIYQRRN